MWKPLSAISSVLLLGSAFITHKFNAEVTQEKQLLKDANANLAAAKTHLATAKKKHEEFSSSLEAAKGEEKRMSTELADAKTAKAEADKAKTETQTKLTDVETQKKDWDQKLADLGGLEVIKEELSKLAAKKVESEGLIQQRKATVALNLQKKQDQEASLAALRKKSQMQSQGLLADSFRGAVSDVDAQWGFITINKGNSANVVRNAKLDVTRGGEKIATLIVRNVQTSSAICDVLSGSLASGQQVTAGDTVVVNSESSEKNISATVSTPAAAGADAPASAPAAPAPAADPFGPAPATTAPAADAAPAPAPAPAPEAPAAPAAPAADPFAPAMPAPAQ